MNVPGAAAPVRRVPASIAALLVLVSQFGGTGGLMACPASAPGTLVCCCDTASCCAPAPDEGGFQDACCTFEPPPPASSPTAPVSPPVAPGGAGAWVPVPVFLASVGSTAPVSLAVEHTAPTESPPRYVLLHAYLI